MKHLILVAALVLGTGSAFAGELDNESSVTNQSMNGTVVIRVDNRNNQTAVLASEQAVTSDAQAQVLAQTGSFDQSAHVRNELDQDGGASSWYFYSGYNYYSYVYWYGNWYTPCYTYNYGYYSYYYYSNYYW
ncbi:hypothetical protein [Bdellovibrio bacteriovorus]|uniref:Uncharacterized protein n=1 Tax=Bdellovibrio bacteriovorus str. Tiberius TaxID=1069642 RepID=K7Z788_BDEBC|nr:hypothetical protein [Bdellovibrio bacteriovorus]AFY00149.1 hypothetical protein Bdt_0441 [Bdellovibrio bacteriovorus str. Tiberius]